MKQGKVTSIILAILNVILLVVCLVFYLRLDRTEPKLDFQATEIIYREGMEETVLLEGIKAYDSTDGDITDRIVIEKTIENREDNTIVVFYAVSDKAGNAAKASRVFPAIWTGEEDKDDDPSRFMEAGINAEFNQDETDDGGEEESREALGEATPESVAEPTSEPTQTPTAAPTGTPEPTPEPAPEPTPQPVPTVNPAAPVLVLRTSEISVNAGQRPAWVNVIETLADDKDDYETLLKRLSVSKYDINKPGTYQVTVFTEDTDGNQSGTVPLTIVVK